MSEAAAALLALLIKYVPDLVTEIIGAFHKGATIDDAIAALNAARAKSYEDYIADGGGRPTDPPTPT